MSYKQRIRSKTFLVVYMLGMHESIIVIVTKNLYSATQISGALDPHQYKHQQKRKFSSVYGTEKEKG